jgi:hypothetical protein
MQYRVFRLKEVPGVRMPGDSTLIEAADDNTAIALAERLLDAARLEVWQDGRLVATVKSAPVPRNGR